MRLSNYLNNQIFDEKENKFRLSKLVIDKKTKNDGIDFLCEFLNIKKEIKLINKKLKKYDLCIKFTNERTCDIMNIKNKYIYEVVYNKVSKINNEIENKKVDLERNVKHELYKQR